MADDSLLISLIDKEIPDGRQALLDSHKNLSELAQYCKGNYLNAPDKTAALEETKKFASQSLASVAYQIHSLAVNMLQMMDQQMIQLGKMESSINNVGLTVDIHKEKVARREIGILTTNKNFSRGHKIVAPAQQEKPKRYKREEIDFCALDDIGHGVRTEPRETPNTRRLSTSSSSGSLNKNPSPSTLSVNSANSGSFYQDVPAHRGGPSGPLPPPVQPPTAPTPPVAPKIDHGKQLVSSPLPPPPPPPTVPPPAVPPPAPPTQAPPMQTKNIYAAPPPPPPQPYMQSVMPPPPPPPPAVPDAYGMQAIRNGPDNVLPPPPPPTRREEEYLEISDGDIDGGLPLPPPISEDLYCEVKDRSPSPLTPPPPPVEDLYQVPSGAPVDDFLPPPPSSLVMGDMGLDALIAQSKFKVKALFDYSKDRDDELELMEGDIVYVLKENDDGWFEGVNKDGIQGLFPGNYVTRI